MFSYEPTKVPDSLHVVPYALVAAIGLKWAGLLRRWQAALFFALILLAHYLATNVGSLWTAPRDALADLVLTGCSAGLCGALVSYLGLTLIKGNWSVNTVKNIVLFSILLTLAGGFLVPALLLAEPRATSDRGQYMMIAGVLY